MTDQGKTENSDPKLSPPVSGEPAYVLIAESDGPICRVLLGLLVRIQIDALEPEGVLQGLLQCVVAAHHSTVAELRAALAQAERDRDEARCLYDAAVRASQGEAVTDFELSIPGVRMAADMRSLIDHLDAELEAAGAKLAARHADLTDQGNQETASRHRVRNSEKRPM
jgi:hypothetical protein